MSTNPELIQTKNWATTLIDMYTAGASDAEVAAFHRLTEQEFYAQINENAALAKLVDYGRTLAKAFWESQFRKNLGNKQFNTPLLTFYMKNKYNWADKTENTDTAGGSMDLDTLRGQLTKEVEKFIRTNTPELTDAQRLFANISSDAFNVG